MTDTNPTVIAALSAVMADVQAISKTGRNEQQRYLFRGIDAVMNAVGPALRKHGVVIVPETVTPTYRDAQTTTGKAAREVTVLVTYRVYGPAGDSITITAPGESLDSGDKGTPKAMSVAYRTALLQALTIPTDEPDPDSQSYERASHDSRVPHDTPALSPEAAENARRRMFAVAAEKLGSADELKTWLAETVGYHGSRADLSPDQVAWATRQLSQLPSPAPEEQA